MSNWKKRMRTILCKSSYLSPISKNNRLFTLLINLLIIYNCENAFHNVVNSLFCQTKQKPKDIQFTIEYNKGKQQIFMIETVEPANVWHFC